MNAAKRTAAIRRIRLSLEREYVESGASPKAASARVTRELASHGVAQLSGKKLRALAAVS